MLSTQKLSGLLASLYSAPLEESNWQVFLDGLCEEIQAAHGLFIVSSPRQGSERVLAQGGFDFNLEAQLLYNSHYGALDPHREPLFRNPRLGPILSEELVRAEDFARTEYYNDYVVPHGLKHGHGMVVPAVLTSNRVELIALWRGGQQKPFDRDTVQFINMLLPHLQAALRTRHVLGTANGRVACAEAALDAAPVASFILNASGRMKHLNKAAEVLIRTGDGIALLRDRLIATEPLAQTRLQALIDFAVTASGARLSCPGGAVLLPRASGRRPLHALVLPLRLSVDLPAHVLVRITDPETPASHSAAILASFYGFTRAESEIANSLLAGLSIDEIATLRRVSLGTVRQQVKSILTKTGVSRQSDLIRLLMTLPQAAGAK
jgi:DNA-binding CsgD family transcriptional regulator